MNFQSYNDESTKIFENEYKNINSYNYGDISLRRLNTLFQEGKISANEHIYLVEKLFPATEKVSLFAIASLVTSVIMWILLLRYEFGGKEYSLLSGESRSISATILCIISITLSYIAYKEIKMDASVKGTEFIAASFVLSTLIFFTLVIPYWIWFR